MEQEKARQAAVTAAADKGTTAVGKPHVFLVFFFISLHHRFTMCHLALGSVQISADAFLGVPDPSISHTLASAYILCR